MASKYTKLSAVTATEPTVTEPTVTKAPVADTPKVTTPAPAPKDASSGNDELRKKVEELEAKVDNLVARLSRKMKF